MENNEDLENFFPIGDMSEPIELDYIFGSLELSKRFNVARSVICDLAKSKKVNCIWHIGIPLFNQAGVDKIGEILANDTEDDYLDQTDGNRYSELKESLGVGIFGILVKGLIDSAVFMDDNGNPSSVKLMAIVDDELIICKKQDK